MTAQAVDLPAELSVGSLILRRRKTHRIRGGEHEFFAEWRGVEISIHVPWSESGAWTWMLTRERAERCDMGISFVEESPFKSHEDAAADLLEFLVALGALPGRELPS